MFVWVHRLDQHFPIRYAAWALCFVGLVASSFAWARMGMDGWLALAFLALVLLGVRDVVQRRHAVRRNSEHGVKLLANLLPFIHPGELLHGELPQQVFRTYWPMASASSFAAVPAA
jgi:hypothetical protein